MRNIQNTNAGMGATIVNFLWWNLALSRWKIGMICTVLLGCVDVIAISRTENELVSTFEQYNFYNVSLNMCYDRQLYFIVETFPKYFPLISWAI